MKNLNKILFLIITMVLPTFPLYAQDGGTGTLGSLIFKFGNLLGDFLPLLIFFGVIVFVWGVIQYVIGNDEEAKTKGRDRMIYGIIGFSVIVGLYGLVNIVINTFDLQQNMPLNMVPNVGDVSECGTSGSIEYVICTISNLIKKVIPLLISLGVIIFIWGVIQYVIADEEEAKTKGRDRMLYGIIGLVVVASIWGLVSIVVSTFDIGGGGGVANEFLEDTASLGGSGICDPLPADPKLHHLLNYATCLITKSVVPLIFALAVAMFVWGVVQYVISAGNEEQKEKGRQYMLWGIIALAVMVSVWGIVRIVGGTFGIEYAIPQVKQ